MWRFVKIISNDEFNPGEFIQHVPEDWDNDRVKEELEDIIPVDEVEDVPYDEVPEEDRIDY